MSEELRRAAEQIVRGLHETASEIRKAGINGFGNAVADHADALAALLAELDALRADAGWQPIESAPRDGTDIILGAPAQTYAGQPVEPRTTIGHWMTEEECRIDIGDCGGHCHCREYDYEDPYWLSWDGGFTAENPPTHWRPLPASPAIDAAHQEPPHAD